MPSTVSSNAANTSPMVMMSPHKAIRKKSNFKSSMGKSTPTKPLLSKMKIEKRKKQRAEKLKLKEKGKAVAKTATTKPKKKEENEQVESIHIVTPAAIVSLY